MDNPEARNGGHPSYHAGRHGSRGLVTQHADTRADAQCALVSLSPGDSPVPAHNGSPVRYSDGLARAAQVVDEGPPL